MKRTFFTVVMGRFVGETGCFDSHVRVPFYRCIPPKNCTSTDNRIETIITIWNLQDVVCALLVPVVLLGAPVIHAVPDQGQDVGLGLREQQSGPYAVRRATALVPVV
jgi:hypothetical protein